MGQPGSTSLGSPAGTSSPLSAVSKEPGRLINVTTTPRGDTSLIVRSPIHVWESAIPTLTSVIVPLSGTFKVAAAIDVNAPV